MRERLDAFFAITSRGSTVGTELRAGVTTFLTMAYILAVNPQILQNAGMPVEDVAIATAIAAAAATLLMGLLANFPFALAPGMGLNAYFAFGVVIGMGISWQVALAAVFIEGILFMVLALGGVRTLMVNAIPKSLKRATTVGIGLFLAFIGLKNAGIVVDHPETLVTLGDVGQLSVWGPLLGTVVIASLMARRVRGAILYGILAITAIVWIGDGNARPSELVTIPGLPAETFFALDFSEIASASFLAVILAFLFVDIFDTAGTLIGVGTRAGFVDDRGRLPGSEKAFFSDAAGTTVGAAFGTSTVTSYIESGAGVEDGGRTGLTAVVVAMLFLGSLFFTPLIVAIPVTATAPALIVVGAVMMFGARDVEWRDLQDGLPAFLCIAVMPLTFSIANGIAVGIVSHVVLQLLTGKSRKVHPVMAILAVAIVLYHAFVRGGG